MSDLLSGLMITSLAIGPYLGGMLAEWVHLRQSHGERSRH